MEGPKEIPFSTDPMRTLLDKDEPNFAGKLANMRSGRKAFLRGDPRDAYPGNLPVLGARQGSDDWRKEYWNKGWDFAAAQELNR